MRIFILIIVYSLFFQNQGEPIVWTSEKLDWSDFQGSIPYRTEGKVAVSTVIITMTSFEWHGKVAAGEVKAFFLPMESWTRVRTEEILYHEQGHFDLTEIYARLIRKDFTEKKFSEKTVSKEIKQIFELYENALVKAQQDYDKETEHHKNKENQRSWNKKIRTNLKKLEKYSNPEIIITLR